MQIHFLEISLIEILKFPKKKFSRFDFRGSDRKYPEFFFLIDSQRIIRKRLLIYLNFTLFFSLREGILIAFILISYSIAFIFFLLIIRTNSNQIGQKS